MNIDREIKHTMDSLNGMKRVPAPAYFYTRLRGRMERQQQATATRLRWSVVAVVLVVLLNMLALYQYGQDESSVEEPLELLAQEYNMDVMSTYDQIDEE